MSAENRVVFDEWEVYVASTKEGPLFISFDVGATREDLTEALPHSARVQIQVQAPNDAGAPVQPESDRLWNMEDALCTKLAAFGVDCRMVGRLTHQGMRELVFQLADWETFRTPVGLWMAENSDYEFEVSEHEGWEFFDNCIRPSPLTASFERRTPSNEKELRPSCVPFLPLSPTLQNGREWSTRRAMFPRRKRFSGNWNGTPA